MSDPYIIDLKWGQITVDVKGLIKTYKDCRISPTRCSIWNWNLTGTKHVPGTQWTDLIDLLNQQRGYPLSNPFQSKSE